MGDEDMYCRKCGKEIPDNSTFCSHCGTKTSGEIKPEQKKRKISPLTAVLLVLLIAAVAVIVLLALKPDAVPAPKEVIPASVELVTPEPTPQPTPKPTPTPAPTPAIPPQEMPANGEMHINPTYVKLCPFSVSVRGSSGYYVYLEYLYAPESYNSRHLEGTPQTPVEDIAFFVRPNCTVEIDVPVGVYKLYYASGKDWYGWDKLFGEKTVYSMSDEPLVFYMARTLEEIKAISYEQEAKSYASEGDSYHANIAAQKAEEYRSMMRTHSRVSLELWAQADGNIDTVEIDADAFPG